MATLRLQHDAHSRPAVDGIIRFREDPYGYALNTNPLVMTANIWKQDGIWVLCNVWVHPRFRGLKLTHRMMTALLAWMVQQQVPLVVFPVKDANMSFWNWMAEYYDIRRLGDYVHIKRPA